jgi:hypothetical protein
MAVQVPATFTLAEDGGAVSYQLAQNWREVPDWGKWVPATSLGIATVSPLKSWAAHSCA